MLLDVKVSISNDKNLYIRQNPSESARIMGKYENGTKGIIVDQKKTLPSGQVWYRVKETGYWIAQNNPNDNVVKSYLVVTKKLEKEDNSPAVIKPETPIKPPTIIKPETPIKPPTIIKPETPIKPPVPIKPEIPKGSAPVLPEIPKGSAPVLPETPKQPISLDDPSLGNSMKQNPDGDSEWHQEVKR